jgi:hypothetical protein
MPNRKGKSQHPTAASVANHAERKARALESAVGYIADILDDVNAVATGIIDNMMNHLVFIGCGEEHLGVWQHIKYCLALEGPSATSSAKALSEVWRPTAFPDQLTHEGYLRAAGLEEQCKDCIRTIQDAIAMNMILYPDTFQLVMDLGMEVAVTSKLRHAYLIMKRHIADVGAHLISIGGGHPEQAGSTSIEATEDPWIPALAKLGNRPGQASSSTDAMPENGVWTPPASLDAPAGLSMPQATSVAVRAQDWLEEALVELQLVGEAKQTPGGTNDI